MADTTNDMKHELKEIATKTDKYYNQYVKFRADKARSLRDTLSPGNCYTVGDVVKGLDDFVLSYDITTTSKKREEKIERIIENSLLHAKKLVSSRNIALRNAGSDIKKTIIESKYKKEVQRNMKKDIRSAKMYTGLVAIILRIYEDETGIKLENKQQKTKGGPTSGANGGAGGQLGGNFPRGF